MKHIMGAPPLLYYSVLVAAIYFFFVVLSYHFLFHFEDSCCCSVYTCLYILFNLKDYTYLGIYAFPGFSTLE